MEISKFTIFHGNFMIPRRESDYTIFRGMLRSLMIDLNSLVELQITFIVINETLFLADVCLNVTLTYVNISSANQKLISS